jgi:hypothetical protein
MGNFQGSSAKTNAISGSLLAQQSTFWATLALRPFVSSLLAILSQGARVLQPEVAQVSIETGHPMTKSKGTAAGAKRGAAEQRAAERVLCVQPPNCPLSLCEDPKVNESNHDAE